MKKKQDKKKEYIIYTGDYNIQIQLEQPQYQ